MPRPYVIQQPELDGLLLPTANTFFLADEHAWGRLDTADRRDANPWVVLAGALGDARRGVFMRLAKLDATAADFPYADFANACTVMLGFAAPRRLLEELAQPKTLRGPRTIGLPAAYRLRALTLSHALWAVRHVLQSFDIVQDRLDRRELLVRCSRIIDSVGPFFEEDDKFLRHQAVRLQDATIEMISQFGSDAAVCLNGRKLQLTDVVNRMMNIIDSRSVADFAHYRMIFEAYTGRDCRHFFQKHQLQKLTAAATLEDFLESGEAGQYEPGVRYFFGNRIPD